jgi:hypothetical protein
MVTVVIYGKDEIHSAKTPHNCISNDALLLLLLLLLLHFTEQAAFLLSL